MPNQVHRFDYHRKDIHIARKAHSNARNESKHSNIHNVKAQTADNKLASQTCLTEAAISGPIPSPGKRVARTGESLLAEPKNLRRT